MSFLCILIAGVVGLMFLNRRKEFSMVMAASPQQTNRWPKRKELLAWFIWDKILNTSLGEHETPEQVIGWLEEFEKTPLIKTHDRLYSTYVQFLDLFTDPLTYPNKDYH